MPLEHQIVIFTLRMDKLRHFYRFYYDNQLFLKKYFKNFFKTFLHKKFSNLRLNLVENKKK